MLTARATIKYNPMPNTKYFEPWWMLATTSFDFIRLYAYFIHKTGVKLDIGTPYSAHISVIHGEKPINPEFWKYMDGKKIWFQYEPSPYGNNKHMWVDVYCEEFNKIRRKIGLVERRKFHLTIGRIL